MKIESEDLFIPSYNEVCSLIMSLPAEEQPDAWLRGYVWCCEAEKVCASEDKLLWSFGKTFCAGAVQALNYQSLAGCSIHLLR